MRQIDEEKERVCVTGAGGYVASWVVKFLLTKGYVVHGTVRDPCNEEKNGHLKKLENAVENLRLFKSDLLDYESLSAAIAGCTGVFHVASAVLSGTTFSNPQKEVLEPAIIGTRNVLNACLKAKVKKVVVVSTAGAVILNPNWPKDHPMDENCWTDTEFCKNIVNWYCLGKTIAESEAVEFGRRSGLNIVTVCPSIVIGPLLQSTMNASSLLLLHYLKDGRDTMENPDCPLVDVRDVAEALLLVYEKPETEGRHICSSYTIRSQVLVDKLKTNVSQLQLPQKFYRGEGRDKVEFKEVAEFGLEI